MDQQVLCLVIKIDRTAWLQSICVSRQIEIRLMSNRAGSKVPAYCTCCGAIILVENSEQAPNDTFVIAIYQHFAT